MSEEIKEEKWQCPECLRMNQINICTCGYTKPNDESKKENDTKSKGKKIIIASVILVAILLIVIIGKNISSKGSAKNEKKYLDSIILTEDSPTGAVFNMKFSELKPIIGRDLSVGDLNSSSNGWQVVESTPTYKLYGIISSSGVWAINIWVDSKDRVFEIKFRTSLTNGNYRGDTEIRRFSDIFAKVAGETSDFIFGNLLKFYDNSINEGRAQTGYYKGFELLVGPNEREGGYAFDLIAWKEEAYKKAIQ